jgi:hypothetical protein
MEQPFEEFHCCIHRDCFDLSRLTGQKYTKHEAKIRQDKIINKVHGNKKKSLQESITVLTDHEEFTILHYKIHTSIIGLKQQSFILIVLPYVKVMFWTNHEC